MRLLRLAAAALASGPLDLYALISERGIFPS
jgi:hypothetical protein